jgi:hypothetical protein
MTFRGKVSVLALSGVIAVYAVVGGMLSPWDAGAAAYQRLDRPSFVSSNLCFSIFRTITSTIRTWKR